MQIEQFRINQVKLAHLKLTQHMSSEYRRQLIAEGADPSSAGVASQAIARQIYESIPPNPLQRKAIVACKTALLRAGFTIGDDPTLPYAGDTRPRSKGKVSSSTTKRQTAC